MTEEEKQLPVKTSISVEEVPAHLAGFAVARKKASPGFENVRPRDRLRPMLVIGQNQTPAVEEDKVEKGCIFLPTDENKVIAALGQPRAFVICYHWVQWIEWIPREAGGGIIGMTVNPDDELARRSMLAEKTEDGNFAVTEYHNFAVILLGDEETGKAKPLDPVILSFARSNHKAGRQLLHLGYNRRGPDGARFPIYCGRYTVRTEPAQNKAGQKFYAYHVENDGWASSDEVETAKAAYEELSADHGQQMKFAQSVVSGTEAVGAGHQGIKDGVEPF